METNNPESEHNPGPEHTPKPPHIYIQDVTSIPPLLQLLEQVAAQQSETKVLADNQVKVQPATTDSYRAITKALAEKQTEFHTYKPKEERSYRVVLKNMYYSIAPIDIKTEIEKLGHQVNNIWNITQYRTKLPLSMFYVELKPAPNNKDIFLVEYLQQYKIKFEPPKHKREIAHCANCQRYGHTKNYCHLKSICVKCAVDHSTHLCHRKDRSRDVRCFLCGGSHPANYEGCTVYKELRQKTYPSFRPKQYLPPAPLTRTLHTSSGVSYAQVAANITPTTTSTTQALHPSPPLPQTSDIHDLKHMIKQLCEQMSTMLNLLTTVLTKMK
jgi:hypothetical protein